jgi:hypothetical protein
MFVNINDDLILRMERFVKKSGLDSVSTLLNVAVINFMDYWPWNEGCVHSDECFLKNLEVGDGFSKARPEK